ncbi:capsular biosynthesis protein [Thalassobacter stenotrophicus]|uniref:capsular polysaccharide biosynthesis protein n=1 Tax=Thalassobacter TaxID=266808 RepID=UPI00051CC3B7|nr:MULTISPECIES: capsular polysaccharide biosynthesis protein [Thalassobacter]KGK80948.1 capsular biosynthesis protein [Thalassobacter stenotrophicus]KGL02333.1 capsular biosynthesis protein [Thalassobacter sp. 16PALIMAR09]
MSSSTASEGSLRARFYNTRFATDRRVRRILQLAGIDLVFGPTARGGDTVAAYGHGPHTQRAEAAAARHTLPITRVDDGFLCGLHPTDHGTPPIGLCVDHRGSHYDARRPTDLENLLARHPFDDAPLLARANNAMDRMRRAHITKFAAVDPALEPPKPGYVLVIDQPRDDQAITFGNASAATFREMLVFAQTEHPHTRIIIKSHPKAHAGTGHFTDADTNRNITLEDRALSPWALLDGAIAVYTVSSHMGFEAILAGHKPQVFGQPFYAGWGLTADRNPIDRRRRTLTRAQLFAGAMLIYPKWYSPFTDTLCELEDILETLEAQARAWREDQQGYIGTGMRFWKRAAFQEMFGHPTRMTFTETLRAPDRPVLVWSRAITPELRATCANHDQPLIQVEDGFLRSRGLGAAMTPPLSLVLDHAGIYYDPRSPSDLEGLITQSASLSAADQVRAKRLVGALLKLGVTKYNLTGRAAAPTPPKGARVILVPGQVADDASILTGTDRVADNAALLAYARRENPDAWIIYKPHPDVETGLRNGQIPATEADFIASEADPLALLKIADEVWTMTSTLGFEALLRGVPVTTLGAPFYAGWGLTRDLGTIPARRQARPTLLQFVHATLIAYPRYYDAETGLACPPEIAVMRLAQGGKIRSGYAARAGVKLKSVLASIPRPSR